MSCSTVAGSATVNNNCDRQLSILGWRFLRRLNSWWRVGHKCRVTWEVPLRSTRISSSRRRFAVRVPGGAVIRKSRPVCFGRTAQQFIDWSSSRCLPSAADAAAFRTRCWLAFGLLLTGRRPAHPRHRYTTGWGLRGRRGKAVTKLAANTRAWDSEWRHDGRLVSSWHNLRHRAPSAYYTGSQLCISIYCLNTPSSSGYHEIPGLLTVKSYIVLLSQTSVLLTHSGTTSVDLCEWETPAAKSSHTLGFSTWR